MDKKAAVNQEQFLPLSTADQSKIAEESEASKSSRKRSSNSKFSLKIFKSKTSDNGGASNMTSPMIPENADDTGVQNKPVTVKGIIIPDLDAKIRNIEQAKADHISNQIRDFFENRDSPVVSEATPNVTLPDQLAWAAPESWGIQKENKMAKELALKATSESYHSLDEKVSASQFALKATEDNNDIFDQRVWHIRINKPGLKKRGSAFDTHSSNVIITSYDIETSELSKQLCKKFFIDTEDGSRYNLYLKKNGKERMLQPTDKPIRLQTRWMQNIVKGYTFQDSIEKLGLEDHSYYYRFIFREVSYSHKGPSGLEERLMENSKSVSLSGQDLYLLPVILFKFRPFFEHFDLSRNVMIPYPVDFFAECVRLKSLILRDNEIDNFPSAVSQVTTLEILDLSQNLLQQFSFSSISALKNLVDLNLQCNMLVGIPPEIVNLTELKKLNVSNNLIEQIHPSIEKLSNLEYLNVAFNAIVSIPEGITRLSNLHTFILTGNCLTSLPPSLNSLKSIKILDIRTNQITELSLSDSMDKLEELLVDYNKIESFKDECVLPSLTKFSLNHNSLTSFTWKSSAHKLTFLDLTSSKLTNLSEDFFNFYISLEHLKLDHNILGRLPKSLVKCTSLRFLSAHNNKLNEFPEGIHAITTLVHLDLHDNNIRTIPKEIWYFKRLKTLILSSNTIKSFPTLPLTRFVSSNRIDTNSKDSLAAESSMLGDSLKELYIGENELNDECFDGISLLSELEVLNLSFNQITDISNAIYNLTRLQELSLCGNQITNLPDEFDRLKLLAVFYIDCNRFVTLPALLSKMTTLTVFDASWNNLKYNITNWNYDWNWNWNTELKMLDLSGNHRLEIKGGEASLNTASPIGGNKNLVDFNTLTKLRILDLYDIKTLPNPIPIETHELRVRASSVDIEPLAYGVAQSLDRADKNCNVWDIAHHRFQGNDEDHLWGLFVGRNGQSFAKYLYHSFPFNFGALLKKDKTSTIETLLRRTFLNLGREYALEHPNEQSGASGLIVFLRHNTLYTANVGDAMAVLSRNGHAKVLSQRHFCWNRSEFLRVRGLNGFFDEKGNVLGECNLTRAFGHFGMLPFVNANPHVSTEEIVDTDELVILGCNEFWDAISYQNAVDIARKERHSLPLAAKKLRDIALSYGARSSITVSVVSVHPSISQKAVKRRANDGGDSHDKTLDRLDKEISPPVGEVALVFTDIKNSTFLWDNYEDSMRASIEIHNMIMRRSLRVHGGYEVKTEGDAFMVAFRNVTSAVKWCVDVQLKMLEADWPLEILSSNDGKPVHGEEKELLYRGLSVRMGIHYGVPFCNPDPVTRRMDYFGPVANRSARVCAQADGGQIYISQVAMEKLAEAGVDKDPEIQLYDIGERALKGIPEPEYLHVAYAKSLSKRHQLTTISTKRIVKNNPSIMFKHLAKYVNYDDIKNLMYIFVRLEKLINITSSAAVQQWLGEPITVDADSMLSQDLLELFSGVVQKIENSVAILQITSIGRIPGRIIDDMQGSFGEENPVKIAKALVNYFKYLNSFNNTLALTIADSEIVSNESDSIEEQ